tara:strand:- start:61 stop:357 length:297 start_codon:yes stop_codon:yes gene_type:complete
MIIKQRVNADTLESMPLSAGQEVVEAHQRRTFSDEFVNVGRVESPRSASEIQTKRCWKKKKNRKKSIGQKIKDFFMAPIRFLRWLFDSIKAIKLMAGL